MGTIVTYHHLDSSQKNLLCSVFFFLLFYFIEKSLQGRVERPRLIYAPRLRLQDYLSTVQIHNFYNATG